MSEFIDDCVEMERIYNGLIRYERRMGKIMHKFTGGTESQFRMAVMDISACLGHVDAAITASSSDFEKAIEEATT